jgi:hypothetical protein
MCAGHAGEFDEYAVAGGLYDPATIGVNFWINEFTTVRFEGCERALFVAAHKAGVVYRGRNPMACVNPSLSVK